MKMPFVSIGGGLADMAALALLPRPMVFTNGVFDILHRGHVEYLEDARALGASLVVAVNSDDSVRMLGKGPERPINAEYDRGYLIASLRSVSAVLVFAERTPVDVLARIRPDIYVKGGDYDMEVLPETTLVRSWGGQSRALAFREGYSTTSLLRRISG